MLKATTAYQFFCHFKLRPLSTLQCPNRRPATHGCFSLLNHPNPEISCFYQKGFSQITTETTGKAVHALYITGFVPMSVLYTNTLINMYSRFSLIRHALYLFDQMPERNEASWNTMMSGLVRLGLYSEAFRLFYEMLHRGVEPSGYVIASLITGCDRSASLLIEGTQAHGFAIKSGLLYDVFVGTAFLHFYGSYRLVSSARKLFKEMPYKNVVSWTSLMVGCSDDGEAKEVLSLFEHMRSENVSCNENTMASVITSCGLLEDKHMGHQLLGHVFKLGLDAKVSVANSLISMFGRFGDVEKAGYIFDHMNERDTISWNSILSVNTQHGLFEESFRYFLWMRHVNKEVNSTTISSLLSVCGSVDNLMYGKVIHSLVFKMGHVSNVSVCNTLLLMYSDSGRLEDAEFIFEQMPEKDLISWNSMISSYAEDGRSLEALETLVLMTRMGKIGNHVSFTSALAACSNPEFVIEGKILHGIVVINGIFANSIVGNALVTMYAKSGKMVEAKTALQTMQKRDKVTWNALIGGFAENEEPDEALRSYQLMREECVPRDYITMVNLLGACTSPENLLKHGMPVHVHIVSTGYESEKQVQNSLIVMYAKCGDLNSSKYIFDGLAYRNSFTWNTFIAANAKHGNGEEILKLIGKMISVGVDPDQFSFSGGLAAAAKLAVLEEGQQLHNLALKHGLESDFVVINSAIDMYNKCGEINDVLRMLPPASLRPRLTWNVLISAFSRHGFFQKAKETFHEMLEVGPKPDHVTFVSLLSACSHGGLVEDGLAYYNMMTKEFSVKPAIEHCVCMIDLLGRSGRLEEADAFITEMPCTPNDLIWRSLLSACKLHGNVNIAQKAVENLLKLYPSDDSAYVLYSNICANTGRWEVVNQLRKQMHSNNIQKQTACSWVKLKNRVASFGIGDKTDPDTEMIYTKLEEIKKMIKEAGYFPDTSNALQDTDEEQKEHNLWNHSERLALAFGLINSPEGSAIKVFKNLRVCSDCHSVYKFVSLTVKRKIVLRDPYRFHHFSGGECSCSDFW